MLIGVPRETTPDEARVAASPSAVRALRAAGHEVLVEQSAGVPSGWTDDDYIRGGAEIAPTAEELWHRAELVWKVARPAGHELRLLRAGQRVFALLHVGEALPLGVIPLPAERCRAADGSFPVLAAMSGIAGRLAVEAASVALARANGGRGLLLGGVPGVPPAEVVVLGAGVAGTGAAAIAAAMGASVTLLDTELGRLRAVTGLHGIPGLRTLVASAHAVERALALADVVVAAVRDGGERAPRVATRAHLALMQPGAVVVDLSVTDGGAFESTVPTTLAAPSTVVDGVVHIGVPNFAGGVPRTASLALSQAALPFVLEAAG